MKKLCVFALLSVLTAFGCQQKEEPKNQVLYPGGVVMKTPEEIRQLEGIAKANPKNAEGWIALGNALMDTKRFQEAVDAYQKALAIDLKNPDVRVDMGTCYRGMGRSDRAAEEYRKAIKINPNHLNAHRNLGVVSAYDLNDKATAVKELEKYLALAPNASDAVQIEQLVQQLKTEK